MRRHNYRQTAYAQIVGRLPAVVLHRDVRAPGVALGGAMLLTLVVALVDLHRMSVLDSELAALHDRIAFAQRANAGAEGRSRAVLRLQALRRAVLVAREDGIGSANALTHIGNGLPPQTWLTHVESTATGTWTIAGRSTRIEEIGATLAAIANIDRRASARLVSINAGGKSGKLLDFVIAWEHAR